MCAPTRFPAPVTMAVRGSVISGRHCEVPGDEAIHFERPDCFAPLAMTTGVMPESNPPIELKGISLSELRTLVDQRRLPPVDKWDPPGCGHSGMRIAADGTWYHDGAPIDRPAMVRLFSSILRREPDGGHVLVTPVEKLAIDVDRTAFRALEMRHEGFGAERRIGLGLDSGDALIIGPDHPLRIVATAGGPSPRVAVRQGLEAELARPVYYELAEIALAEGADPPGVWSDGHFFALVSDNDRC